MSKIETSNVKSVKSTDLFAEITDEQLETVVGGGLVEVGDVTVKDNDILSYNKDNDILSYNKLKVLGGLV